jgi:hypothetical protein
MKEKIILSPKNSLIFIMDPIHGDLPDEVGEDLISFTQSCVAVGTLAEHDGNTKIVLTDEHLDFAGLHLVYDGKLAFAESSLSVCDTQLEELLTMKLRRPYAQIKIFTNDLKEPDEIHIFVDI